MKYIMLMRIDQEKPTMCWLHPIIFQEDLVHALVAVGSMETVMAQWPGSEVRCMSAGFLDMRGRLRTHGQSESLGIKSHSDDGFVIINDPQQYFVVDILKVYADCKIKY